MSNLLLSLTKARTTVHMSAGVCKRLSVALMLSSTLLLSACGGGGGLGTGNSSVAASAQPNPGVSSASSKKSSSSSAVVVSSTATSTASVNSTANSSTVVVVSSKSSTSATTNSSSVKASSTASVTASSVKSTSTSSVSSVKSSSSTTSTTTSSVAAAIASLEIAPGSVALAVGASQQLVAVGKLSSGSLKNMYGKVTWRIASGSTVASITSSGVLKRLTAGEAQIEATAEGKTASLKLAAAETGITLSYDNSTSKWTSVNVYLWTANGTVSKAWPGDAMTNNNGVWTYSLDSTKLVGGSINVIFNNGSGGTGNQTGDLTASASAVYKDGTWTPTSTTGTTTSAQVAVIDGTVKGGGTTFTSGTVLTINANTSTTAFTTWTGASAAYIFTDPTKSEAQLVVPNGVSSLALQALFATATDAFAATRNLYASQCSSCHGVNGADGPFGGLNALHTSGKYTIASLATKISTTMPFGSVGSCTGSTAGTCAYDIANMILSNKWLPVDACVGTACNAGDSLDARNLRLLTKEEYINSVNDIFKDAGVTFDATILSTVPADSSTRNFNTASFLSLDYDRTSGYQTAATEIAKQIIAKKAFFSLANNCGNVTTCVTNLGKKIFRRPLTSAEVSRYVAVYNTNTSDAGKAVVQALLISPNFLYRSEMGVLDSATGLYRLTNYEVATLLSYTLWASAPDDALLTAAAATTLDISGQVTRMLADTKAERGLRRFAQGWLINSKYGYGAITSGTLPAAFDEETIRFVMESIKADLPYKTLLTANYTYANTELAQYYGSSTVASGWAKSTFKDSDPRSGTGLLGHASFLASRIMGETNPSPIKRGNFVREVLMCQELPPPQKAGFSISTNPDDTNRDATFRHTNDPGCQGCHQYLDGVGFGLENYGSNGLYRATETTLSGIVKQINSLGTIKSLNSAETKLDPNSEEVSYTTVPRLATLIANSGQGAACYSRQYYRYVVGRDEADADEHIIPVYSANMREGGGMKQMLIDLATNPSFIMRRQ